MSMNHAGLLYCQFCDKPFYPDQRSERTAHQLTCKPWESRAIVTWSHPMPSLDDEGS